MNSTDLKYRIFWTWDHGTFWDDSFYWHGRSAFGPNQRRSFFLEDYKRMVDYGSMHGINGIVIWGALRAHDNGEEQLKELVRYAKKKGVQILPGCGIFSYGGVYYDPRRNYAGDFDRPMEPNPHSLHTWLEKHPQYAAIGPDGKPYKTGSLSDIACPSRKENIEWFQESLQWLFSEFAVGGVQVEIGDYAVCHCDICTRRRGDNGNNFFNIADMVEPYSLAFDAARKINPDAWVICETYSSFVKPQPGEKPGFGSAMSREEMNMMSALPKDSISQWVLDRAVGWGTPQTWETDVYIPTQNNIARIHAGSQWTINSIAEWAIHPIGNLVKKARASGINGVSIFGEESPASPPNEANYLMFSEFSGFGNFNPGCDLELFYSQTLDPLYGGTGMAKEWERIYIIGHILRLAKQLQSYRPTDLLNFHPVHNIINQPDLVDRVCKMTSNERQKWTMTLSDEAHALSSRLSGEPCRRWAWLENWLWRAEFLHRTAIS